MTEDSDLSAFSGSSAVKSHRVATQAAHPSHSSRHPHLNDPRWPDCENSLLSRGRCASHRM